MTVIFFAKNEEHGLDVLKRMLQFCIACKAEYLEYNYHSPSTHSDYFIEMAIKENSKYADIIKAIDDGKIKLSLVPMNQFYKVGWASNDTI